MEKTTVTTKITELLQYAGFRAEYAGNIGKSFAELLLEKKRVRLCGIGIKFIPIGKSLEHLSHLYLW